jgi:hypothetical protein
MARTAAIPGPPSRRSWRWTTPRRCSVFTCPPWMSLSLPGQGRGRCPRPSMPTWPGTSDGGKEDRGYGAIQSTWPRTVSYGLNDSPAGLAAWVLEKWRGWADSGGDIDASFSRDFLLTVVTLYWATQTITSSIRDYVDNRWLEAELSLADAVTVPTAVAVFAHQFIDDGTPPREWAERLYDIRRWTPMPSGGHFPSAEETRPAQPRHRSLLQRPRRGQPAAIQPLSRTGRIWPDMYPAKILLAARRLGQSDALNWLICAAPGRYCNPESKQIFGREVYRGPAGRAVRGDRQPFRAGAGWVAGRGAAVRRGHPARPGAWRLPLSGHGRGRSRACRPRAPCGQGRARRRRPRCAARPPPARRPPRGRRGPG